MVTASKKYEQVWVSVPLCVYCCFDNKRTSKKLSEEVIMMSEKKRFVCIDIGYGDDWYITDNGKKLSEMEIVNLLNEQDEKLNEITETNEILNEYIRVSDELDKEKLEVLKDVETEIQLLNSYLVEKGLAEDYIRWIIELEG